MKPGDIVNDFLFDGAPFRIISGAMHYFRCVPEYWADRLRKLRGLGLNTIETYVAWNLHEPQPGAFRFDGMLDIERFIGSKIPKHLVFIVKTRLVAKIGHSGRFEKHRFGG